MATEIIEIVDDDDDEVTVLYSNPASVKGTTTANAIPVEDYEPDKGKRKIIDDDDIIILPSLKTKKKRSTFFIGDSSNSKSPIDDNNIPPTSTCEICTDETPSSDMFRVLGCHHYYCTACIVNYVSSKLEDNVSKINCPVPICKGYLEPYPCRSILPKEVFDKWGDALCEAVILGSEKFYCPFNDCSGLLIDDNRGEDIRQSECLYCHRLFCWKCKVPWHAGITCQQRMAKEDESSKEGIMLANLAKRSKWQRCPGCAMYVQRISGCSSMRCRCGCCFNYTSGKTV